VATAGSNPVRGTYEQHIEIYLPAYLFTTDANGNTIPATRPTITSSPTNIGYAGSFQVQTPNAANISSVVLVRPGSDTHAFDMDQRLVGLTFTAGSGVLTVTGPPTQNIAPPGYYMLLLVNSAGVPSIANFVQVSNNPTDQPPSAVHLLEEKTRNGILCTPSVNSPRKQRMSFRQRSVTYVKSFLRAFTRKKRYPTCFKFRFVSSPLPVERELSGRSEG
jgi:Domain of unknown function (DUF1929)